MEFKRRKSHCQKNRRVLLQHHGAAHPNGMQAPTQSRDRFMGLSKICLSICILISTSLFSSEYDELKMHALYLMQQNQIEDSIQKYREYAAHSGRQDFDLLRQMGLILLQKGIQSGEKQTLMMTLFGAGLSGSASAIDILEKGIHHPDPQIQLLSLHFIGKFDDDRTSEIFNQAMSSDFLAIRMEAAFYMAQS